MFQWLRRYLGKDPKPLQPESAIQVTDHGEFLSARYPSGETQTMSWSELTTIEIQTNDSGPWGADFWWVLSGPRDKVFYPQGASGERELMEKLLALPEFDTEEFTRACGCTSNATFLCWDSGGAD